MRETVRPGAFLLSAPTREQAFDRVLLAAGNAVTSGTLIAKVGDDYVPFNPDASDGSEQPVGITLGPCDATLEARAMALLVRGVAINAACLAWPIAITDEQKSTALGFLAANTGLALRGLAAAPVDAEPEGYVGPLDLVPGANWLGAWSFARALSASMLSENGFTLYEDAGQSQQTFAYGADGSVDVAAILAWAGAAYVQLVDAKDNAASFDLIESPPNQPWAANQINGFPTVNGATLGYEHTVPSGDQTFIFVLAATGGSDPIFLTNNIVGGDSYGIMIAQNWNVEGDLSVTTRDQIGNQTDWVSESVPFTPGEDYLLEVSITSSGIVTARVNGAVVVMTPSGDPTAPTSPNAQLWKFLNVNTPEMFWANSLVDSAEFRQNVADMYGITLSP